MSAEQVKHPALTKENKLREKVFLTWWKQRLNMVTGARDMDSVDENDESVDWYLVDIKDAEVFRRLHDSRDGDEKYKISLDTLEDLGKDLAKENDRTRKELLLKQFCPLAMQIAIEEFDTTEGTAIFEVFDQNAAAQEKFMRNFVESHYTHRY